MRTRNHFALVFLTFLVIYFIISCTKSTSNSKNKNELQIKTEISIDTIKTVYPTSATNKNKDWTGDEDTLNLSINDYDFTIYPGALLKWGISDSVKLSEDMYITRAYFHVIGTDLLLFCEMSDSDTGTSAIFRISLKNRQIKWKSDLIGFNLGQPAIRKNYGYVTAIGIIGKLDLETGKFVYLKPNLYDRKTTSFNNFDTILFKNNKTFFVAKRTFHNMIDTVTMDEKTLKMTIKK